MARIRVGKQHLRQIADAPTFPCLRSAYYNLLRSSQMCCLRGSRERTLTIKTADIVLVNLPPTKGGEKSKTRPCLVLVGEGHPWESMIVIPITDHKAQRPPKLFAQIPHPNTATGLSKPSCVDCFQIRCISTKRLGQKLGVVSQETLDDVLKKIGTILNIGEEHIT